MICIVGNFKDMSSGIELKLSKLIVRVIIPIIITRRISVLAFEIEPIYIRGLLLEYEIVFERVHLSFHICNGVFDNSL